MQARQPESLSDQIARQIQREAGLFIVVDEEQDGALRLTGRVDSDGERQAAEDLARMIAPDRTLINDIEIEDVWPFAAGDVTPEELSGFSDVDSATAPSEIDPDFTDTPITSDPIAAPGASSSNLDDPVDDGDVVYFAPTDPVIQVNEHGDPQVLGGFTPTSMDSIQVDRSSMDNLPGDEAITSAILRELRENASTTDLNIHVTVREGIVTLNGSVPDLVDAENVEEVARSVPGVVDVSESLEVTEL